MVKVYEVSQQRFQTCGGMVVGFSSASGTRALNLAICRRESKSEILSKWPGMCTMFIENEYWAVKKKIWRSRFDI